MKKEKLVCLFVGMILFLLGCQGAIAQQTWDCPVPPPPNVCFCDDFEYAVSVPAPLEWLTAGNQARFLLNTWYSSPVLFNFPSSSMWATKPAGGTGVAHEEPFADNFVYNTRQSCSSTTKLLNFTSPGTYRFTTVQKVIDWPNLVWIPNWLVIFNRPPLQPGQSFGDPVIKVELVNTTNIAPSDQDTDPHPQFRLIFVKTDPTQVVFDAIRITSNDVASYLWVHQRTAITNPTTVTLTAELRRANGTPVCDWITTSKCSLTVIVPAAEAYRIVHNPTNNPPNPRDLNIRIYSVVRVPQRQSEQRKLRKLKS